MPLRFIGNDRKYIEKACAMRKRERKRQVNSGDRGASIAKSIHPKSLLSTTGERKMFYAGKRFTAVISKYYRGHWGAAGKGSSRSMADTHRGRSSKYINNDGALPRRSRSVGNWRRKIFYRVEENCGRHTPVQRANFTILA